MNSESVELPQEDIVDRIAAALPDNLRTDFYREMRHCRSLPENDEMLRMLRIKQFLTLLTESVPKQIVGEREKLESLFTKSLQSLKKMIDSSEEYQRQLDLKMTRGLLMPIRKQSMRLCMSLSCMQQLASGRKA